MPKTDEKIAREIAFNFLKDPIISCKSVGKGSNNKNLLVKSKEREVVIKLSLPHKEHKAYQDYLKEKWCIQKSSKKGVLGPKVLDLGKFKGRAYMIETFVSGINGKKLKNKLPVYEKLGKYAKLIHSIKTSGFGEKLVNPHKGTFAGSWKQYLNYNIKSLNANDRLIKLGVLTLEQSQKVKKIFINIKKEKYNFGLNHGDIFAWNVLVEKSGKINLLDWGEAEAHIVPHFDFINILRRQVERRRPNAQALRAFIKGYGMSKKKFELLKPELFRLMLLISFDKLRWAIDRNPSNIKEFTRRVRKMIKLNNIS